MAGLSAIRRRYRRHHARLQRSALEASAVLALRRTDCLLRLVLTRRDQENEAIPCLESRQPLYSASNPEMWYHITVTLPNPGNSRAGRIKAGNAAAQHDRAWRSDQRFEMQFGVWQMRGGEAAYRGRKRDLLRRS